jgi:hypothetical protein
MDTNLAKCFFLLILLAGCKSTPPPQIVVARVDTLATGELVTSYRPLVVDTDWQTEHEAFFRAIGYRPTRDVPKRIKLKNVDIVTGNKQTASRGGVVATDSSIVTAGKKQRVETVNKDVEGDYAETTADAAGGSGFSFRLPSWAWLVIAAMALVFLYFQLKKI